MKNRFAPVVTSNKRAIIISRARAGIGRKYRHLQSRARNDCRKGQEVAEMIEIAVEKIFATLITFN